MPSVSERNTQLGLPQGQVPGPTPLGNSWQSWGVRSILRKKGRINVGRTCQLFHLPQSQNLLGIFRRQKPQPGQP